MIPPKAVVVLSAGILGIAFLTGPAFAVTNTKAPSAGGALSKAARANLRGDIAVAKAQLSAASDAVQAAEDAADAAAAKLPEANKALKRAQAAVSVALAAQAPAEKAHAEAVAAQVAAQQAHAAAEVQVTSAQAAVDAQHVQVTRAQDRIDALKNQVAVLARQRYISGSEGIELGFLMESRNASEFAEHLQAMARIARSNSTLFDQMTALQADLVSQLAQFRALEQAAADRATQAQTNADVAMTRASEAKAKAAEMQARADNAQAARDAAASAKTAITSLVDTRQQEVANALTLRRHLKATYEGLQKKLVRVQGVARTHGTGRDARAALAWGLKFVGSGANYDGLCLGFVDDAYDPPGGRMPTAIAQWYRAKDAGFAHPEDRNPPVGAQVFWLSGNPAKHVAMYAGGGMVLTTGAEGGRVGLVTMEHLDGYGPYLGWADAYYG